MKDRRLLFLAAALLASIAASGAADVPIAPPAAASPAPADEIDPVARRTMQVHFLLGTEYYKEGNYRAAIEAWGEVLRIDPTHALAAEKIRRAKERVRR